MWNQSENQITLLLIRHGATKANQEHRYLGKTEESLVEEGIRKLVEGKEKKGELQVQYLFTSPMKRCLETAAILYPRQIPICIPEWEEIDFGDFEGKTYLELQGNERYQEWVDSKGRLPFPNGESREEFVLRCEKGFQRMYQILVQTIEESKRTKDCTVGLLVHGGTIMALLHRYCGDEYFDYQVANGEGYRCKVRSVFRKKHSVDIIFTELERI